MVIRAIPICSVGSVGGEVGEGKNSEASEMGEELDDGTEEEVVDEVKEKSYVEAGSSVGGYTGSSEFTPPNTDNGEFTTPNPSSRVPYVGLEFSNEDQAFQFYNEYAMMTGFGIRKQKLYRSRTMKIDGKGELLSRVYVCHKAGFKQNDKRQRGKVVKQRPEVRVGCEALMRIKAIPSGFIVDKFVESHNHELVPEDIFRFRSHQAWSVDVKLMVERLIDAGLSPAQIIDAVREALGVYHDVVDMTKDCGLIIPEDTYPSCSCGRGLMRPVLVAVPGLPDQRQILVCPITSVWPALICYLGMLRNGTSIFVVVATQRWTTCSCRHLRVMVYGGRILTKGRTLHLCHEAVDVPKELTKMPSPDTSTAPRVHVKCAPLGKEPRSGL